MPLIKICTRLHTILKKVKSKREMSSMNDVIDLLIFNSEDSIGEVREVVEEISNS